MKLSRKEIAFREQDSTRERLRQIINDPAFRGAVELLRERYRARFALVNPGMDPALALALQHAYLAGANEFPDLLVHLSEAPTQTTTPPLVEWGTLIDVTRTYEHTSNTNAAAGGTSNTNTNTGSTGSTKSRARRATRSGDAGGKSA